jgi:nucleolar protein 58
MNALLEGLSDKEMRSMSLGLAHSVSRYKLKFTTDKVDTMIVQAVSLLGDIDKELNNYAMRLKEWYSWHFPELEKIVSDNETFARIVLTLGMRKNISNVDLTEVVPEEIAEDIQKAVEISFGTDILEEDEINIKALASQVVEITEYRATLSEYLSNRMKAISPNLTILIGELVAAKLIAHAGSLINLAKLPASTIQILGAEKALFRAMKTRKNTPKYGIIYNASLVGQAQAKFKGRIARTLAAKASLCVRYDALGEDQDGALGNKTKAFLENRLETMESDFVKGMSKPATKKFQSYHSGEKRERGYNQDGDVNLSSHKRAKNLE